MRYAVLALLLAACGTTRASGACKDYVPICQPLTCETTADGCRVCACTDSPNARELPLDRDVPPQDDPP